MKNSSKSNLVIWIKRIHSLCLELNSTLIDFYKLNTEPVLKEYDILELPTMAVKHKIILRHDIIESNNEKISYHVHGTGITFLLVNDVVVHFEYYPKTVPKRMPILGVSTICRFIESVDPNNLFVNNDIIVEGLNELFHDNILIRLENESYQFYLNEDRIEINRSDFCLI